MRLGRLLFVIFSFLLVGESHGARLALVIGNAQYLHHGKLANPVNDATAIAASLETMEFEVFLVVDANQDSMQKSISGFLSKIEKGDTVLLYYSGHGLQFGSRNFLIPVDANIQRSQQVPEQTVSINDVLTCMVLPGEITSILLLDACRNWEGENLQSAGTGLSPLQAPNDVFIGYATGPGQVASDGEGSNSPFTTHLLRHIHSDVAIEELFREVSRSVLIETGGKQAPWQNSSLTRQFKFSEISTFIPTNFRTGNLAKSKSIPQINSLCRGNPDDIIDKEVKPSVRCAIGEADISKQKKCEGEQCLRFARKVAEITAKAKLVGDCQFEINLKPGSSSIMETCSGHLTGAWRAASWRIGNKIRQKYCI
jgi:hypothetical protein